MISAPDTAAMRRPIPAIRAAPMPSRPSMNSQSAHQVPAIAWYVDWNGPRSTEDRKPLVGEPPWIHARADGVAYPNPNVLSTNAHRKTKPVETRSTASALAAVLVSMEPGASTFSRCAALARLMVDMGSSFALTTRHTARRPGRTPGPKDPNRSGRWSKTRLRLVAHAGAVSRMTRRVRVLDTVFGL